LNLIALLLCAALVIPPPDGATRPPEYDSANRSYGTVDETDFVVWVVMSMAVGYSAGLVIGRQLERKAGGK